VVEEVYEIQLYTGPIPPEECVVTHIAIQEIPKDD
jgi:hypothetical protein